MTTTIVIRFPKKLCYIMIVNTLRLNVLICVLSFLYLNMCGDPVSTQQNDRSDEDKENKLRFMGSMGQCAITKAEQNVKL